MPMSRTDTNVDPRFALRSHLDAFDAEFCGSESFLSQMATWTADKIELWDVRRENSTLDVTTFALLEAGRYPFGLNPLEESDLAQLVAGSHRRSEARSAITGRKYAELTATVISRRVPVEAQRELDTTSRPLLEVLTPYGVSRTPLSRRRLYDGAHAVDDDAIPLVTLRARLELRGYPIALVEETMLSSALRAHLSLLD